MNKKDNKIDDNSTSIEVKRKLLIDVYKYDASVVDKKSDTEVEEEILMLQKSELKKFRNPNKFWIINGLPEPKYVEPTTSKKWGALVVISLFVVLAGFFGMFMWLAFR